jgi:hypothetical protein
MSVQRRDKNWRVRWQEGDRWRSRTFERKRDALLFDAELRRKRRLGELARLDAGMESLDTYDTARTQGKNDEAAGSAAARAGHGRGNAGSCEPT